MLKWMRQLEENRLDLLDRRLTRGMRSVSSSPVDATDDHAAEAHSVGAVHAPTQALVKATCTCSGGDEPFLSTWPQLDMPRRSVSQHLAWTSSPHHFNWYTSVQMRSPRGCRRWSACLTSTSPSLRTLGRGKQEDPGKRGPGQKNKWVSTKGCVELEERSGLEEQLIPTREENRKVWNRIKHRQCPHSRALHM